MAKEYIERGALIAEYDRVHVGAPGGARKLMVDAPAADVVEVVRCHRCARAKMILDIIGNPRLFCTCWRGNPEVEFDDFCSYGERKEADQ